jgi:histidinol-phosphate aminotransferase
MPKPGPSSPANVASETESELEELRREIDATDRAILERLNERARLVEAVGRWKRSQGRAVYTAARERDLVAALARANPGPFPNEGLAPVFREIISATRSLEERVRVAFLGPEGTFSHLAVRQQFGTLADLCPVGSIPEVFAAVERRKAGLGIVPVENTTEGVVTACLDAFLESDVSICGEVVLRVSHQLMSRATRLEEIRKVVSHPQPLAQCRGWLDRHLPGIERMEVASTAAAAAVAVREEGVAAIGSTIAAEVNGLQILEPCIEDRADNTTRFLLIGGVTPRALRALPGQPDVDAVTSSEEQTVGVCLLRRPRGPSRRGAGGEGDRGGGGGLPLLQGHRLVPASRGAARPRGGRGMSLEKVLRPHIVDLEPYTPGKPVEELERELGISGAVKLASNENPLGPSPKAVDAIRQAALQVHRYPDGASFRLRAALAGRLRVDPGALVFGAGADEILELLVKVLVGPGDEVVYAWPSFAMYPIVTRGVGGTPVTVPLDSNLVHDLDAMARAVGPRTKLVFVCNPNNPTGTSVGAEAFDRFVGGLPDAVVLAVDEAYSDFARRTDFPDSFQWIRRRAGTIVLRTFSKLYGLAGLRVGYGVGDPELIGYLERARHPFNVNVLAEIAALAALDDTEHVERTLRVNREGIDFLNAELPGLGIEVWPSDANFILARVGKGVYERLLREGVIVRPVGAFGLPEHVRISVGLPEENERLVKALRRLREAAA